MSAAGAAAGAAAAAAAEAEAKRQREEEEEMTAYRRDELDADWEFKILRSARNEFKDPGKLQRFLDEEAAAGWVLVEKFDDARLRLKRRRQQAVAVSRFEVDPYRTYVGTTPEQQARQVAAVVLGILLLVVLGAAVIALVT